MTVSMRLAVRFALNSCRGSLRIKPELSWDVQLASAVCLPVHGQGCVVWRGLLKHSVLLHD